MVKSSIEKLSESIGYDIGMSDDVTQANLLNGFCKALSNSMQNDHHLDLQLCYIADKLNGKTGDVIRRLVGYIETKEEERRKF